MGTTGCEKPTMHQDMTQRTNGELLKLIVLNVRSGIDTWRSGSEHLVRTTYPQLIEAFEFFLFFLFSWYPFTIRNAHFSFYRFLWDCWKFLWECYTICLKTSRLCLWRDQRFFWIFEDSLGTGKEMVRHFRIFLSIYISLSCLNFVLVSSLVLYSFLIL